jgi:protein-S-isoprenylcysteine O-methyltransferase Ste14
MDASLLKPVRSDRNALIFDAVERGIVLALYTFLTWRVLASFFHTENPLSLLMLMSEGVVVVFVLLRRRTRSISLKPWDWVVALGGTVAPLLVQPAGGIQLMPLSVCVSLMLCGLILQVAAKFALGRGFGVVAANRGVVARGPYRYLRHPMYAGYLLTHIGFFLGNAMLFNGIIYLAELALQITRLRAEERLLSGDPAYMLLRSQVRYRLIPGVF